MPDDPMTAEIAAALEVSVGLLVRRLRQTTPGDALTVPERAVLTRLDRGGPTTTSELARREQISPQSMGATVAALEDRGLVRRRPDPTDGRQIVLSPTKTGLQLLRSHRGTTTDHLTDALSSGFSRIELKQLMTAAPLLERLALTL